MILYRALNNGFGLLVFTSCTSKTPKITRLIHGPGELNSTVVNLSNLMDETRATRVEDCAESGFSDTLAWLSEDFELTNKSRDEMMRNADVRGMS